MSVLKCHKVYFIIDVVLQPGLKKKRRHFLSHDAQVTSEQPRCQEMMPYLAILLRKNRLAVTVGLTEKNVGREVKFAFQTNR